MKLALDDGCERSVPRADCDPLDLVDGLDP